MALLTKCTEVVQKLLHLQWIWAIYFQIRKPSNQICSFLFGIDGEVQIEVLDQAVSFAKLNSQSDLFFQHFTFAAGQGAIGGYIDLRVHLCQGL